MAALRRAPPEGNEVFDFDAWLLGAWWRRMANLQEVSRPTRRAWQSRGNLKVPVIGQGFQVSSGSAALSLRGRNQWLVRLGLRQGGWFPFSLAICSPLQKGAGLGGGTIDSKSPGRMGSPALSEPEPPKLGPQAPWRSPTAAMNLERVPLSCTFRVRSGVNQMQMGPSCRPLEHPSRC